MGGFLDALPDAIARAARMASVPAELRALNEHLPERMVLEIEIEPGAALGETACQLLKLASLGGALEGRWIGAGGARFVVRAGARAHEVTAHDLCAPIQATFRRVLEATLDPTAFTRALEAFATRAARLAALQTLTRQMLLTEDLDQALGAMLAGITSGAGLAFNRAALFVRDDATGAFVGTKAIGPFDEREAHRIWEAIELEDKSFEEQLRDSVRARVDARLEAFVRTLVLEPGEREGDEVCAALAASRPVLFARDAVANASLARLGTAPEVVLAPIAPRGQVRALLYADNAYDRVPVGRERLEVLGFFIDEVALVWDNLALLRKVEQLARFDELTGLYNRRGFDERFREEQSRSLRTQERCAVLLCDLDHFKAINDTRGHEGGDAVLRRVGEILRGGVRELDTAARHGGDEFVVLLAGASRDEAIAVAARIGAAAKKDGISLSIGGAAWPDDCTQPSKLLSVADARLYEAKRWRGRACFGDGAAFEL